MLRCDYSNYASLVNHLIRILRMEIGVRVVDNNEIAYIAFLFTSRNCCFASSITRNEILF